MSSSRARSVYLSKSGSCSAARAASEGQAERPAWFSKRKHVCSPGPSSLTRTMNTTTEASTTFADIGLPDPLVEAIREIGYETPTAIQTAAIPVLLSGSDLLGQAQTGTGKTAAFALPLLSRIDLSLRAPQILVLTPTRELAIQVAEAFKTYARKLPSFQVLPIYGGQSMGSQLRQLERGPHVVVGTPGRVMDHLRRETLDLSSLVGLVLDEADEMLNMGFVEDIEWILEHTPQEKQTALFSATMPGPIRKVATKYLRDPEEVKIHTKTSTVETITQQYWLVSGLHKLDALTRILEVEEFDAALIFVRTKTATIELAEKLEARGHACAALNGDLSQELRERTIQAMKKGKLDVIVATDVAARGLDVERITHVINYDIPTDPEAYVHRIGRTGRAGREGKAILFVAPRERRLLGAIERTTRQKIEPIALPTKNEVSEKRIERFKAQIEQTFAATDLGQYAPVVEQIAAEQGKTELEVASALCFLLQQSSPFVFEETDSLSVPVPERWQGERRESERPRRERRSESRDDSDKAAFRIEVGRVHGVTPGNIVGAIANSIGIDGSAIGRINLFDEFSTVDLPRDLPREALTVLQNVHVRDRKLHIRPYREGEAEKGPGFDSPTKKFKQAKKPFRSAGKEDRPHRKSEDRPQRKSNAPKPWERDKRKKGHTVKGKGRGPSDRRSHRD